MRTSLVVLIGTFILGVVAYFTCEYFGLIKPPGKPIVGVASIIEGDILEIESIRIRLVGVDAPESGQLCHDDAGKLYSCGQDVALALAKHVNTSTVACTPFDQDMYNRTLAVCHLGKEDIAVWLIENGLAITYPGSENADYVAAQDRAKTARKGIWLGAFDLPWDWREAN